MHRELTRWLEATADPAYLPAIDDLERLARDHDLTAIEELAGTIRARHFGTSFALCAIMNARSDGCPEDCAWCAQSIRWFPGMKPNPFASGETALTALEAAAAARARRFSLVASGRALSPGELEAAIAVFDSLKAESTQRGDRPGLCASLGLLDATSLSRLARAGVTRYHCNLETAPSFFHEVCTTHGQAEKRAVIGAARAAGMGICSGGIIGLGETLAHRIELAVELARLRVDSIPLNLLVPIPGTPLEVREVPGPEEVLLAACLMRIANPRAEIRLAAGRSALMPLRERLYAAAVTGAITGGLLTTAGVEARDDADSIEAAGYTIAP